MIFVSIILLTIIFVLIVYFGMKTYKDKPQNIAVYSGSFNPLHIGHKAIVDNLSKKFDWVYLVVTPQNPLKDTIKVPIEERLEAVDNALIRNGYWNVVPSDVETTLLPPYYTINTLRKLKENEPKNNFTLVIGADCLADIKEWNSYQKILEDFGVIVFPRGEKDVEYLLNLKSSLLKENPNYKIEIETVKTPNISSTELRIAIKNGEDISNLLM